MCHRHFPTGLITVTHKKSHYYYHSRKVPSINMPSSTIKTCKTKRKISFHQVEIIELPIVLGDHPCVQDGPPVSVCWIPQLRCVVDLNRFEQLRTQRRPPRRINKLVRQWLLTKQGVSQSEMDDAIIAAKKIKLERFFSLVDLESPSAETGAPDVVA